MRVCLSFFLRWLCAGAVLLAACGDVTGTVTPTNPRSNPALATPLLPEPVPQPAANPAFGVKAYPEFAADVLQQARQLVLVLPAFGTPQLQADVREVVNLQAGITPQIRARIMYWDAGAVKRWYEIATQLIGQHDMPAPRVARAYALLGVAQYLALKATDEKQRGFSRVSLAQLDARIVPIAPDLNAQRAPSAHAAVAAASYAVLAHVFPAQADALRKQAQEHQELRIWAGMSTRSDVTAGIKVGELVAQQVLARAQADNAFATWNGALPTGAGKWVAVGAPSLPAWGQTRPWVLLRPDQFRPGYPPQFGTAEFTTALSETRELSANRTPEQAQQAALWVVRSVQYWNDVAYGLIQKNNPDEMETARMLAVLNMVLMDTSIAVWESKFSYVVLRPAQADAQIVPVAPPPNTPAFVCEQAAFAHAAARVLSRLLPAESVALNTSAQQASTALRYAGTQFGFDIAEAEKMGNAVAGEVLAKVGE